MTTPPAPPVLTESDEFDRHDPDFLRDQEVDLAAAKEEWRVSATEAETLAAREREHGRPVGHG